MPSFTVKCKSQDCRSLVKRRSVTGTCRSCLTKASKANCRHCDKCGAQMYKSAKGSLCRTCINAAGQSRLRDCKVCNEPLLRSNVTGFCFTHMMQHRAAVRAEAAAKVAAAPIKHKPYTVSQLIDAASFLTATSRAEICGPSRIRFLFRIRSAIVYLARPHYSTLQIGRILGGRDHSTIVNAHGKALDRIEHPGFSVLVKGIEREALALGEKHRATVAAELERLAA